MKQYKMIDFIQIKLNLAKMYNDKYFSWVYKRLLVELIIVNKK
jgi:hypothetical protein